MSRSGAITVRPMERADLPEVLDLLRLALGATPLLSRSREWFDWKHRENPFGPSIVLVAESGGRLVGLRAFMRWELVTPGGHLLRCVRAVDTATHPEHQRKGIFRHLTLEALEAARAQSVDLVFNTPNPRSGAGYLSMGWQEVGRIGIFLRPHPGRMLDRGGSEDLPEPGEFAVGTEVKDSEVDDRPPRGLRTPRTPKYLRWRFSQHPTARYLRVDREGGIAIVRPNRRRGRKELVLSDLFGRRVAAARAAVAGSRAAYVASWFSEGSPERRAIVRAGLLPVPGVKALTLVARQLTPLSELGIEVGDLRSWDLALSDLELL